MIRLVTAKRLRKLENTIDDLLHVAEHARKRADKAAEREKTAIGNQQAMARRLYDPVTGAEYSSVLEYTRKELRGAKARAADAADEALRLQRHNQALRDALTALGGAVIELQDITQ